MPFTMPVHVPRADLEQPNEWLSAFDIGTASLQKLIRNFQEARQVCSHFIVFLLIFAQT